MPMSAQLVGAIAAAAVLYFECLVSTASLKSVPREGWQHG